MQQNGGATRRGTYRFVHASDLHLDAPVRGIAAAPQPLRAALRDAPLRAWQSLVDLAVERRAAFVILAGGLFGTQPPALRSCVALRDGLERLRAHAIEVCIALNPDDITAAADLPWLTAGAKLFAENELSALWVMREGQYLAALRGTSGGAVNVRHLAGDLRPLGIGLEIGVLPTPPADAPGDKPTAWATEVLPACGPAYWAIGGSPAAAVLHEKPWIVCAGTVQGRGLEASELGPKGCTVVEIEDGRIASMAPERLDHVRFERLEVEIDGDTDRVATRRRLARELDRRTADGRGGLIVVEAVLHGRLPAGFASDRLSVEGALLAELRSDAAAASVPTARSGGHDEWAANDSDGPDGAPRTWWVRVRDLTARDDRQRISGPRELRRVLTEQSEALGAPLPGSTFLARTFAPLLRQWGAETDLASQRELVRDAAALALDVLGSDQTR